MRTRCLSAFLICVQQLLLPYKIIRMFGPKTAILVPKYAFLGTYRPCRLIWCPDGWLVGGCCARAVSHRTPFNFMSYKSLARKCFTSEITVQSE